MQLLALQFVLGSSIVLPTTPLRSHGAAAIQAGRSGLAQMAYNPQPSKNKPKKIKEKIHAKIKEKIETKVQAKSQEKIHDKL